MKLQKLMCASLAAMFGGVFLIPGASCYHAKYALENCSVNSCEQNYTLHRIDYTKKYVGGGAGIRPILMNL